MTINVKVKPLGAVGKMIRANNDAVFVDANSGTVRVPLTLNDVAVDGVDLDSVVLVDQSNGSRVKETTNAGGTHRLGVATTEDGTEYVYDEFTLADGVTTDQGLRYAVQDKNGSFGMASILIGVNDVPAPELGEPPVDPEVPVTTPETPEVPVTEPEVPADTPATDPETPVTNPEVPSTDNSTVPLTTQPVNDGGNTLTTENTPTAATQTLGEENLAETAAGTQVNLLMLLGSFGALLAGVGAFFRKSAQTAK